MINNINLEALQSFVGLITEKPEEAISSYGITATWKGGVNTEIRTANQQLGSTEIDKDFTFMVGEPDELLGNNQYPTPQEYLLGGMAGCMMVGFVAGASAKGIILEQVALKLAGDLDLKGFLEVGTASPIGFKEISFCFDVKGSGTQEEYDELIQHVQRVSPNYRTISDPITVTVNKML